ncbi:MAG: AIR synthase related protein, partial [Sphingobium sp.]
MSRESAFIDALRAFATDPAARGLCDDAAVLPRPAGDLVLTQDMLVEGVHYLPDDDPADVAWKLLAVNLSDLAAKGAAPVGVLLGYAMTDDADWDAAFAAGLGVAAAGWGVPLLGGDTVRMPPGAPRTLGLTAIGRASGAGAPARNGAQPGDMLWVSGTIGDAALGLAIA